MQVIQKLKKMRTCKRIFHFTLIRQLHHIEGQINVLDNIKAEGNSATLIGSLFFLYAVLQAVWKENNIQGGKNIHACG